jgi:hypothetical protein
LFFHRLHPLLHHHRFAYWKLFKHDLGSRATRRVGCALMGKDVCAVHQHHAPPHLLGKAFQ